MKHISTQELFIITVVVLLVLVIAGYLRSNTTNATQLYNIDKATQLYSTDKELTTAQKIYLPDGKESINE